MNRHYNVLTNHSFEKSLNLGASLSVSHCGVQKVRDLWSVDKVNLWHSMGCRKRLTEQQMARSPLPKVLHLDSVYCDRPEENAKDSKVSFTHRCRTPLIVELDTSTNECFGILVCKQSCFGERLLRCGERLFLTVVQTNKFVISTRLVS